VFGPWKIEKKKLKSSFLFTIWFEESQEEKNREEKWKENLSCYEEKYFLSNMRGKWRENLFLMLVKNDK